MLKILEFSTDVAVSIVVPEAFTVIAPVEELTVATVVFEELYVTDELATLEVVIVADIERPVEFA